jgi:hypothetical protein
LLFTYSEKSVKGDAGISVRLSLILLSEDAYDPRCSVVATPRKNIR